MPSRREREAEDAINNVSMGTQARSFSVASAGSPSSDSTPIPGSVSFLETCGINSIKEVDLDSTTVHYKIVDIHVSKVEN